MAKLRTYIYIICVLTLSLRASAQIGEYRNDWTFGVNGGMTMNRVSFYPDVSQKWAMGETFGLTARYTSERYFKMICSLQAELNYTRLGWKEDIILADGTRSLDTPTPQTYHRDIHYLQLPLLARLALGREYRGVAGYLVLGPQLGYAIREKAHRSEYWAPEDRINLRNAQYNINIQNKFDYGITGGLGMEVSTAAGHFLIEGRYYFGLGNIFKASKKDPFSRSANGTICAKITYLLPNKDKYGNLK